MKKKKTQAKFEQEVREIHGNEIKVIGKYTGAKDKILVQDAYGVCEVIPNNLLNGQKTNIQSAVNKNEYFINQAREIHGDRYDYSKVEYQRAKTKIEVICSQHGSFLITPDNLLQGRGCSKCYEYYNVGSAVKNKNELIQTPATVYLIRCYNDNENFYKYGLTKKLLKHRFDSKTKMPYQYEIIQECKTNLYEGILLEKLCLNYYKDNRYKPLIDFGGRTECFKTGKIKKVEEILEHVMEERLNRFYNDEKDSTNK